jgi:hypothetical protein
VQHPIARAALRKYESKHNGCAQPKKEAVPSKPAD